MFDSLLKFCGRSNKKRASSSSSASLTFLRLERRDLRTTFFVDAANGNDANPGTSDQPFATYLPVVWAYDQPEGANIGTVQLEAGDELVFREGNYSATFQNPSDRNIGTHRGLYLRGLEGTAENPIIIRAEPGVIINPSPEDGSEQNSVQIENSTHVELSGFEFTGLGTGLFVGASSDIEIHNNWFHDIDGAAVDNLSGIMLTANDGLIEVHENLFHDIFDRNNGASENSRALVTFGNEGGDIRVFNNTVFNSIPIDAEFGSGGIVTKHGSDSDFSVNHNVFYQVRDNSIGTSNPNSTIAHNLILSSNGVSVRDLGGPAFFNDILVEHNTFVDTDRALIYNPNEVWYETIDAYDEIGEFSFQSNLVEEASASASDRGAISIGLGPETDSALVDAILDEGDLQFDGNVYSHTDEQFQAVLFSYVEGRRLDRSFEQWQSEGYDLNGQELDFGFDDLFRPQNEQASRAGWLAGEESRLTLFALDSNGEVEIAPQIEAGQSQTFALMRSGDDIDSLNESLTVSLNASLGHLELPATVTFQSGETELQFEAIASSTSAALKAVRIFAEADGTENNIDAWVRVSAGEETQLPEEQMPEEQVPVEQLPEESVNRGTVVFNEDFEDGNIDGTTVPPQDRFSRIVEDEQGNNVYEITYEQDEFDRKIEWVDEPFNSIEASYRTRLPEGIDLSQNDRHWAELKLFRVFESSGNLGEVFTTVIQQYDAEFEDQGEGRWEIVHVFANEVQAVRIPIDSPADWLDLRYFMQWNTAGNSDGVLMIWHDGQLTYENQAVHWFDDQTLWPDGFWVGGNYSGGQEGQPVPTTRRQIDNVFAATNGTQPLQAPSEEIPPVVVPPAEAPPTQEPPVEDINEQARFTNGLLTLPGSATDTVSLDFSWLERFAAYNNELGLFIVEDSQGTVSGLSPVDPDYSTAVLSQPSRQVIFESGQGAGETKEIWLQGGTALGFYLIQNATSDDFLSSNLSNQPNQNPLAFFSVVDANPDQFQHLNIDLTGEHRWQMGWEDLFNGGDLSFTDAVIELQLETLSSEPRVDQLAQQLAREFQLEPDDIDFFDWRGRNERWIRGGQNWFFIEPDGSLFAWNNEDDGTQLGSFVAKFDSRYHQDIFLFNDSESMNIAPNFSFA